MHFDYDENYLYYLYSTPHDEEEIISETFNNGLLCFYGNNLESNTLPLDKTTLEQTSLKDLMKNHTKNETKTTFLIKIPTSYITGKEPTNSETIYPIPFWLKTSHQPYSNRTLARLIPNLVASSYNATTDQYTENENYTPNYDPSGLHYDKLQLNNLLTQNEMKWYRYAISRSKLSYDKLFKHDKRTAIWDKIMKKHTEKLSYQTAGQAKAINQTTQNDRLPDAKIYPEYDFSFDGLKNTFDQYDLKKANDKLIAIDKETNEQIDDPLIIERIKFAKLWFKANSFKTNNETNNFKPTNGNCDDYDIKYEYSFNEGAQATYNKLKEIIQTQLINDGNIDTEEIMHNIKETDYEWSSLIIKRMFKHPKYTEIINHWFRSATPDALEQTEEILTSDEVRETKLSSRKKR